MAEWVTVQAPELGTRPGSRAPVLNTEAEVAVGADSGATLAEFTPHNAHIICVVSFLPLAFNSFLSCHLRVVRSPAPSG